jgi:hypothetical protein
MEHPVRISLLAVVRALASVTAFAAALAGLVNAAPSAAPTTGAAAPAFATQPQALAEAFPGGRIERRAFVLTPEQVAIVESRARVRLGTRLATAYAGWRGDTLMGVAFFDSRTVRTMPALLMVVVAPDSTVARVDVLAFHEPPDYRPPDRWLGTFEHHSLDNRLWPDADIRNLSGASLSARAVAESVRLAIALYTSIAAPAFVRAAAAPEPR